MLYVDLTTPLNHDFDPRFDQHSRADSKSSFMGLFHVRYACLFFFLKVNVSIAAVPMGYVIVKAQLPGIYGSKPTRVRGCSLRTKVVYLAINPWQLGFNFYISHLIGPRSMTERRAQ